MSFQISSSVSQSHAAKSYGASLSQGKSLGGAQGNVAAECATWIEDNKDFYQEIMNGTAKVSAQEAQTFLNWWAYAQQTAHGAIQSSNWGNEGAYAYGQSAAASLPAGAIEGIDGKVVYNEETANITFTGDERPVHVWSNDVNVDISSLSAKVSWEITTDTSINPNEQVMKGVITDGASGKSTVIFVHDFQDATIKTTTPKKNLWSDSTGKVTWSEYTGAKQAENASSNFSVEGEKQDDGSYLFEDATNVQYSSSPLGKDEKGVAKTQISEVYGHLGVDLAPSDKVSVVAGNPKDAKGYTITITHKDGSKDIIYTHQNGKNGYQININGLGAQITFGNTSGENGVPAEFKDTFSVNGSADGKGATDAVNHEGDTSAVTEKDGKLIFDDPAMTEFVHHTDESDSGQTFEIISTAPATVYATSNNDVVKVKKDGSKYVVTVLIGGVDSPETNVTYNFDGPPSSIRIGCMPSKLQRDSNVAGDARIQVIGADGEAPKLPEKLQAFMDKLGVKDPATLLSALKTAKFPYKTVEELIKAANEGSFPPANPTEDDLKKISHTIYLLDSAFAKNVDSYFPYGPKTDAEAQEKKTASEANNKRLIELLNALYGSDHHFALTGSGWATALSMDGKSPSHYDQTEWYYLLPDELKI